MNIDDPSGPGEIGRAGRLLLEYLTAIPNVEALAGLLHPDVSFTLHTPTGRTNRGRERILAGLRREFGSFYRADRFELDVLDVFGAGNRAAARFTITAETALGPYHNHYAIVARFSDDGLLAEAWEYLDSASAREQLGGPSKATRTNPAN